MSRFLFTGDTHGHIDIGKFNHLDMSDLTKDDYLFILGDFGAVWDGGRQDMILLDMYESFPCTVLFIDGNHENFHLLNSYPVEYWCGGKVHKLRPTVYHLMRGQGFTIDGKTFLTIGGAVSQDKEYREPNISWWKEEVLSEAEKQETYATIEKYNGKFDYILSHCAPTSMLPKLESYFTADEMTDFLDDVYSKVDYDCWFFGHYHRDKILGRNFFCLYWSIV